MKIFLIYLILLLNFSNLNSSDWKFIKKLNTGRVNSLDCIDSNNCFCEVQQTGFIEIYNSSDAGNNWYLKYQSDYKSEPLKGLLNAQKCISPHPNFYYIIFWEGCYIAKSTDAGKTFKKIKLSDTTTPYELVMLDTNKGFIITVKKALNYIFVTNDGWETFYKLDTTFYGGFSANEFTDNENIQMIYGFRIGNLLTNQIVNFNINQKQVTPIKVFYLDTNQIYRDGFDKISVINDSVMFMVGSRGMFDSAYRHDIIYKTSDKCKTWKSLLDSMYEPRYGLSDISFYDAKNGVAVGKYGKIVTTNDGGDTWVYNELPEEMLKEQPLTMKVAWAGKTPIIGTWDGNIYRYEGDFFKFVPVPNPVTLISPINNSVKLKNEKAEFIWFSAEGYQKFYFQLSESPDFVSLVSNDTLNKADITVSNLKSYTNYFWRVAFKYNKKVIWSEVNTFRTQLSVSIPFSPGCDSTGLDTNPVLEWTKVNGAEFYQLRYSKHPDLIQDIIIIDNISDNKIQLNNLDSGKTYYWKVKTINNEEESEWSSICSFTTKKATSVSDENGFRIIYPNPAGNYITLSESDTKLYTGYEIYDISGRLLQKSALSSFRIDISTLERGSYYLRLHSPSGIATAGFLKME